MRHALTDETLRLYFEGELNSYNADNIEKEIEAILKDASFKRLVLDFGALHYISSAGLRIVLKLKQKYGDVRIEETSLEVYDVLAMTGFTNIMEVKKALKRIYLSGAQVIGEGFTSTVYRIDKDTIIKVFNLTTDPAELERELKLAKQAFVLGIPTAISYDIVKVDEKLGVRFEMLDCMSLRDAFRQFPERYEELLDRYVALLKKINTTDCMDASLPDLRTVYLNKVERIRPLIGEKYYAKAKKLIESVPSSMKFVHGDCHFKNIMVQGDDYLLIDMDTLSRGACIYEFAALRAPYIAFEEDDHGNSERFLGVTAEFASKLFHDIIRKYFGRDDQALEDKIALVGYIHMVWWNAKNTPENEKRGNGCRERLCALLDRVDDLDLGE